MITLNNLSKNYGKKVLFDGLSLSINENEKIGLIGPNGTGKSTLFSLILGETEPSSGDIHAPKNIRIGYLPQESTFHSERTVLAELTEGDRTIIKLIEEKELLENNNEAASERYGRVLHELDALGYFELEHKAKKILMGLGFKERDFNKPITQLSGGWQMRTLLAKLLTVHYDILLLDEPTNYLDLSAALWFKDYLSRLNQTFIMISHDKAFLNEVTNYTLILENGSIFKVKGNYEHYERIKAEQKVFLTKQFKEQEKKREQLEKFISRFHAQPNKASSVRAKRTALEKMSAISLPQERRESIRDFAFPPAKRSGYKVISLQKISKSYADITVYRDFDFEVTQGEKAVLAGENGAGKSTLLKIMAGVTKFDSGERIIGHNVDIGYFSQTRMDILNPENSVLQEAYNASAARTPESCIRTILGAFLFSGDEVDKPVRVLSGGEKSRLILAKLLLNPPNFLLLDEPTTHLDVDAVDALIKALNEYTGTIVFISHDIHFVRSLANVVFEVKNGSVRKFPGNFDYYLYKRDHGQNDLNTEKPEAKHPKKNFDNERLRAKREEKARFAERKRQSEHNSKVRSEINKLQKQIEKLSLESYAKARALSNSQIYHDEETVRNYGRRLKEIEKETQALQNRINELEKEFTPLSQ